MSIKGTVAKTYEREWSGNDGNVILHSFQLQGDKRYFRSGTDKLVSEGEAVSFDIEGNNQVVASSLTKMRAETQAAPAPGGYTQGRGRNSWGGTPKSTENFEARQKYWENKELRDIEVVEPRITFSAAQRDAIEVIKIAMENDALAFGNASKGAKLGMILDFVDEVTARFYSQRINAAETVKSLEYAASPAEAKGARSVED